MTDFVLGVALSVHEPPRFHKAMCQISETRLSSCKARSGGTESPPDSNGRSLPPESIVSNGEYKRNMMCDLARMKSRF
jgi:hypothetical protein